MTIQCISPIDGSIYVSRQTLAYADAKAAAHTAKTAQGDWAKRSLSERISLVQAGVAAIGAMNDEIVPELAWQMGRPIRYGGEFGGFDERASYMAQIAQDALADIEIENSDAFRRVIKRVPHGVVLVVAPALAMFSATSLAIFLVVAVEVAAGRNVAQICVMTFS